MELLALQLKKLWIVFLLICLTASLCLPLAYAEEDHQFKNLLLRDINTHQQIQIFREGRVSIFTFFEPDCSWCFKQVKALKKLQQDCKKDVNIILVGINGDKQQLRKEWRKSRSKLPAITYHNDLISIIGSIEATPTNVFFDNQQQMVAKLRGYIQYEKLAEIFKNECQ